MMHNRCLLQRPSMVLTGSELVIEISQDCVYEWALEVTLLVERLTDGLTVIAKSGYEMSLSLLPDAPTLANRLVALPTGNKAIKFDIPRTQAEYLQAVLLRRYRDEVAEVNHIHLDGTMAANPFDLTFMFENARAPMTSEEAAKLLDQD
jgi:hypothetical protein